MLIPTHRKENKNIKIKGHKKNQVGINVGGSKYSGGGRMVWSQTGQGGEPQAVIRATTLGGVVGTWWESLSQVHTGGLWMLRPWRSRSQVWGRRLSRQGEVEKTKGMTTDKSRLR